MRILHYVHDGDIEEKRRDDASSSLSRAGERELEDHKSRYKVNIRRQRSVLVVNNAGVNGAFEFAWDSCCVFVVRFLEVRVLDIETVEVGHEELLVTISGRSLE